MFKIIQQRLVEQIKEGALLKEKFQQSIKKLKLKLKELTRELKSYLKQFFKANLGYKSYINKLENLLNFYKKDLKRLRAEYHVRFAKKKKPPKLVSFQLNKRKHQRQKPNIKKRFILKFYSKAYLIQFLLTKLHLKRNIKNKKIITADFIVKHLKNLSLHPP